MRKTAIARLAASLLLPGLPALSQDAAPAPARLTFEVASVKVADSPNGVRGGCHGIDSVYTPRQQSEAPPLGRCVITDSRLSHMIGIAFGVTMQNLKTGPDWIQRGDLRYNVQAKAENPSKTTEKQLLTMLQNLLVDRFQLKFHYEQSEVSGFALLAGKNGDKLHPSTAQEMQISFTGDKGVPIGKPGGPGPLTMHAVKCPISQLVSILTFIGDNGPGVDKTGLTGEYDFTLFWDNQAGPALSSAVRDQLGLRIQSEKVSVSTLVVDSAEKASSN